MLRKAALDTGGQPLGELLCAGLLRPQAFGWAAAGG